MTSQSIWKIHFTPEQATRRSAGTLAEFFQIQFTHRGDDFLQATMPVLDRHKQPLGILHGGASCVLAETVGSTAANFCVDSDTQCAVGLSIATNHIRSARSGTLTATATPLH